MMARQLGSSSVTGVWEEVMDVGVVGHGARRYGSGECQLRRSDVEVALVELMGNDIGHDSWDSVEGYGLHQWRVYRSGLESVQKSCW